MTYFPTGKLPETTIVEDLLVIRQAFSAGGGGSADDITIFSSNAPFGFRILDSYFYISTTVALATVQLRDATAGAGNAHSDAIAAGVTGRLGNTLRTNSSTISSGGTLVIRRSDNGVAGEVILFLIKT